MTGEDGVAPIHLRIFHGVAEERLVFNSLVVMTTFDEAREMVEELLEAGVNELDVTLVGWTGRIRRAVSAAPPRGEEPSAESAGCGSLSEWARRARHPGLPPGQLHRRLRRQRRAFSPDRRGAGSVEAADPGVEPGLRRTVT